MIFYELVEDSSIFAGEEKKTYGIKATVKTSDGKCLMFADVFNSLSEAKEYIELFNEENLDIVHLEEVLENILL